MTEQWTAAEQDDEPATAAGVPVPGAEPEAQDAHGGSLAGPEPGTETGAPRD
jgi:hypothetical protein